MNKDFSEKQMVEQISSLIRKLGDETYRIVGNRVDKDKDFYCLTSNQDKMMDVYFTLLWTEENRIEFYFRKHAKSLFTEKQYEVLDYLFGLGELETEKVLDFLETTPRSLGSVISSINKKSEKTLININIKGNKKWYSLDIHALEEFIHLREEEEEAQAVSKPKKVSKVNRYDSWNTLTNLFKTQGAR